MNLRRILALMLVLILLAGVNSYAFAQAEILDKWSISNGSILLNDKNNLLIVKDYSTNLCTLMSPDGTALTDEPYVYMDWDENMFIVALENGVNKKGLIDASGSLVVPMQYHIIDVLSDRWQICAVYTEGNFLFSEFQGSDGRYYRFGHYDVYYQGKHVGKLEGKSTYASAYGAYLCVTDGKGSRTYYDGSMTPSTYRHKGYGNTEYDITPDGTFHAPTGIQVGVPDCPLTSDDVKNDIVLVGKNIVDLQGNLYGTLTRDYEIYGFDGDYAEVELNGKVGLIDCTGREVIPCEYDQIWAYDIARTGYAGASKDGMFGYFNRSGEIVCQFSYPVDKIGNCLFSPMTYLYNEDGTFGVLSAAAGGKLPKRYQAVCQDSMGDGSPLYAAMTNQKVGVFDLYGNEIIPANGIYTNIYAFQISCDGTVVVGELEFGREAVYLLSDAYSPQPSPRPAAQTAPATTAPITPPTTPTADQNGSQPASDGSWTCSCGSVNGGNFCPQCGTARPKELQCAKCGFVPKGSTAPRFCENCGNPF